MFDVARQCLGYVKLGYASLWKKIVALLLFFVRSWFFDMDYRGLSNEELQAMSNLMRKWLQENELEWTMDYFDCDDFATVFKALVSSKLKKNAVGIAIGLVFQGGALLGMHAWCMVLVEGKVYMYEPQTQELLDGCRSHDGWEYQLIAVIW